ncbi:death domain-containing protein 1 [Conger conger]|uniref:death domain-containing protein 1 n=1 Tax=Conger conger TaxID=82655 RepID=UPI002A5A9AE4|nr:death domain-containing protein 1 [Conger conger]
MEEDPHQPVPDRLELIVEKKQQLKSLLGGETKYGEQHLIQQMIGISRDLSTFHLEEVAIWGETLQAFLETLSSGTSQEHQTDKAPTTWKAFSIADAVRSLLEDLRSIESYLQSMQNKLDTAVYQASDRDGDNQVSCGMELKRSSHSEGPEPASPQNEQGNTAGPHNVDSDSNSHNTPDPPAVNSDVDDAEQMLVKVEISAQPSEAGNGGVVDGGDVVVADARSREEGIPGGGAVDQGMEEGDGGGAGGEEQQERREDWVTCALPGLSADGEGEIPNSCYVAAPGAMARVMTCEVADSASSRVVSGAEELVSSVLAIRTPDPVRTPCPVSVAIPFTSRHRGSYRDIVVKVIDGEGQTCYISPVSTEGVYGGKRGSFAEVKVYKLGLFAVVSCLRRESFTVPRKGLSLKLSMDSRICFDYLPGTFSAPVIVQAMIQPVDTSFLSMLKWRSDVYQGVLSTSTLVYLTHPSTVHFRRPLTLTLPCPPNPDRKKAGEEPDHNRPTTAIMAARPALRVSSAAVKSSRETRNEQLALLGYKEEQWMVLEDITVRNMQNGLVSFELTENIQRLLVLRLASSVRPVHLVSLVEEVEALVHSSRVTIVLYHRTDQPQSVVVALVTSKDLSWELAKLRKEGYCGPPDPSGDIAMREGEQLLLSFRGNITTSGTSSGSVTETITFHNQRKNRLFLHLTEIDEFGNYSSPHYKGTAIFHRVTKDQLTPAGDTPITSPDGSPQNPVCKLSLTLPKKVRTISRPVSAKVMSSEQSAPPLLPPDALSDELLRWLSEELTEEDAALLVIRLRVRRSSIQLAKLKVPDRLAQQVFHLLAVWRRSLPTSADKSGLLSRYLRKSGRPDLAKELLGQCASPVNG